MGWGIYGVHDGPNGLVRSNYIGDGVFHAETERQMQPSYGPQCETTTDTVRRRVPGGTVVETTRTTTCTRTW